MMTKRFFIPFLLSAVAAALPIPAAAVTIFEANLTGSQENPANDSDATGFATFTLNDDMTALFFEVTIDGLDFTGMQTVDPQDNLLAAHIHNAPVGVNGGVVFGFFGTPFNDLAPNDVVVTPLVMGVGGTILSKWDLNEGNGTTLAAQLANLFAGNLYINFHTMQFPGGEIRGQIQQTSEPATLLVLAMGLGALAVRRRFPR